MKIAIFSDTFFPSTNGVAEVIHNLINSLLKKGHQIQLYTCSKHPEDNLEEVFKGRISHIVLPSLPFWGYEGEKIIFFSGKSLLSINKFKPDIIHSHTPFSAGWEAIFAGKITNTKIIGTHHTFFDDYLKYIKLDNEAMRKVSWKYTVFYYNQCDLVTSPSQSLSDELSENGLKSEIKILPNPIDTNSFYVRSSEEKKKLKKAFGLSEKSIVYMGRVSYEKNIERVISVFAELHKKDPSVDLMIIGDGPNRENIKQKSIDLGVQNKVIFTGMLHGKELVNALQANDVFVTASKSENQPLAVLEAMACGLPVVSVPDRGLKNIITDSKDGFLTDFENEEDTADKILKILNDKKLFEKFSKYSRDFSENYSQEKITSQLENLYKNI